MPEHPEFLFRPLMDADKAEVLAFTEHTWNYGDYISHVWDSWLADRSGLFLAAMARTAGRIAGIDKLSFFTPDEAWFEGMRVHPDFRGRGLAGAFQRHLLNEAEAMGAQTVRFLTASNNFPIHKIAYRDGFSSRFTVRPWRWTPAMTAECPPPDECNALRPATAAEAPALYRWWERSAASVATCGLLHRRWCFQATSEDGWVEMAAQGALLVQANFSTASALVPPQMAVVGTETSDAGGRHLSLGSLAAAPGEFSTLAGSLVRYATEHSVDEMGGLMPDSVTLHHALRSAGFQPDADDELFLLFEKRF